MGFPSIFRPKASVPTLLAAAGSLARFKIGGMRMGAPPRFGMGSIPRLDREAGVLGPSGATSWITTKGMAMTLIERLRALGQRREAEGIYTDQNICEAAIEEIERLQRVVNAKSAVTIALTTPSSDP
jgi:hypothetical protein